MERDSGGFSDGWKLPFSSVGAAGLRMVRRIYLADPSNTCAVGYNIYYIICTYIICYIYNPCCRVYFSKNFIQTTTESGSGARGAWVCLSFGW